MPKVEQIDIKGIFEKATDHKITELKLTKVSPVVSPPPIDDFLVTE